jgi:hypothetical protein
MVTEVRASHDQNQLLYTVVTYVVACCAVIGCAWCSATAPTPGVLGSRFGFSDGPEHMKTVAAVSSHQACLAWRTVGGASDAVMAAEVQGMRSNCSQALNSCLTL